MCKNNKENNKILIFFSVKRWGQKSGVPIIAMQGWDDNPSWWEPLVALLPDHLSVYSVHLPGPPGSTPLQDKYFWSVKAIDTVKNHFKLANINLLGHAEGSLACLLYAATFPRDVLSLFGVDSVIFTYNARESRAASAQSEEYDQIKARKSLLDNQHLIEIFQKNKRCFQLQDVYRKHLSHTEDREKMVPFLLELINKSNYL